MKDEMHKVDEEKVEAPETEASETESVCQHLYEAVGNALVVWMNYKAYHWLLFGPRFHDLHDMFGDFADSVYATVDELAERVRMLDDFPPTSLQEAASASVVKASTATSPNDMVKEALKNVESVVECMKEGAKVAQEQDDPGTVDMFSKFVQIYEKQRWFLKQIAQTERQTPPTE